jgi:hypothetical protein
MWGPVPNFTSHLRCICLVALEKQVSEVATARLEPHRSERRRRVVGG